jgi:hypothetical protein
MMMMDKGTNLSMDDEPTIRGIAMSLHLGELEDFCLCDHFDTNPNLLFQQNPSSFQSLCVIISTTTIENTKFQKSQKHHPLPTKQIHKHPTREISLTTNNTIHTQQEQLHKHPTKEISQTTNKRFEANQHKVQIQQNTQQEEKFHKPHPTPNNKRESTNHPTPNKERIHKLPNKRFEA